jgi:hypothetical protein
LGTLFYRLYDEHGWDHALYIAVDTGTQPFTWVVHTVTAIAGWSYAWKLDHRDIKVFTTNGSKIFTSFHTVIGVVFLVGIVLLMAEELSKRKEKWLVDITRKKEFDQGMQAGISLPVVWKFCAYHLPRYRIVGMFLVWGVIGLIWSYVTIERWTIAEAANFTISTITGAGYMPIPDGSPSSVYVFVAIYASIGFPLTTTALGTPHLCQLSSRPMPMCFMFAQDT